MTNGVALRLSPRRRPRWPGVGGSSLRSGDHREHSPTEVLIGNAQGINILVTATPATVRPPDFTSQIVATVFDNDNNPLSDVPLVFSTSARSARVAELYSADESTWPGGRSP